MNKNTIIFIFSIVLGVLLLLILSRDSTNKRINNEIDTRNERNVLQEIINSTENQNPAINESLKGKTIVINVWATWCAPCIDEIPELNRLMQDFSNDDVVFIALDDRDSTEEVQIMQKTAIQFDYQLYFNQTELIDILYTFKLRHERRALPLNIIIDREGKAAFYYMANRPEKIEEMREYLLGLKEAGV